MIWIASYPRSGNTFFRNILYEVYGLESATFHMDPDYHLDDNYQDYPFVKTHLLPSQLKPSDPAIPAVYIVRDGRDALCSIAHHRKDIIVPGSDYYENLQAAILAERGTFFGGWSQNVEEWISRARLVVRYEDLLVDPVACAERLRSIVQLPDPDLSKVPTFEQLKFGLPKYGSGKDRNLPEEEMRELAKKNFRKGRSGSWKEEMPEELHDLFWSIHGDTMEHLGYAQEGGILPLNQDIDHRVIQKLGQAKKDHAPQKYRVLIEGDKLTSNDNDGVKRYQVELMKGLLGVINNPDSRWEFDVFIQGKIWPLNECREILFNDFRNKDLAPGTKGHGKLMKRSLFHRMEGALVTAVPDHFILYLKERNIKFFHKTYDIFRDVLFGLAGAIRWMARISIETAYKFKTQVLLLFNASKNEPVFRTYDLVHLPLMQHYLPFRHTRLPIVVTMHDFTHRFFPQYHTGINISNAEKGLKFITRRNADIIAVSGSTFYDSLRECGLDEKKVHLVYEAVEKDKFKFIRNREDTGLVRKKYGIPGNAPYFMCLSTIEPRKNLSNTVKAFTRLLEQNPAYNVNLVIAGKKGWDADRLFIHNPLFSQRIIFTGFVDDQDLAALYSEAIALCYISYYEGFGLPLLEAMNCSTPVIYGNNSSMPEVAGQGGLAADPEDIDDIREKMKLLFTDDKLRQEKSILALRQARLFSWRKALLQTLDVYEKIISSHRKRQVD